MTTQTIEKPIYREPGKALYTYKYADPEELRAAIESMRTRQILALKKEINILISKGESCPDNWYASATDGPDGYDHSDKENLRECLEVVREELATREHIPGKKESKELRKARIKKGR